MMQHGALKALDSTEYCSCFSTMLAFFLGCLAVRVLAFHTRPKCCIHCAGVRGWQEDLAPCLQLNWAQLLPLRLREAGAIGATRAEDAATHVQGALPWQTCGRAKLTWQQHRGCCDGCRFSQRSWADYGPAVHGCAETCDLPSIVNANPMAHTYL